jgi:signal transduction histidine kinase
MARFLRFSAFRLAIAYIALSIGVLAIVAVPLWYGWRQNIEHVRDEIIKEDAQGMSDILHQQGIQTLVGVINARVNAADTVQRAAREQIERTGGAATRRVGNLVISVSDAKSTRLAGNLSQTPRGVFGTPGVFTSTVEIDGKPVEALLIHTSLPGGYDLLVGRRTARFDRLESLFEYGLAGATVLILLVAVMGGMAIRRALLAEVHGINQTASAIVAGDLSRRLPLSGGTNELEMLAETVNRMLEQIEQLVQGVRNVSNAIAHDLRTPLAELRVRLELLLVTRPSAEETLLEIESAVADVDRVIGIFNALLRLAQIETGARRSGFVKLDVAHVAREAVDFYQPVAELKGIRLSCTCESEIMIAGDSLLLSQAIGNLIDNAVKYAHQNGSINVEAVSRGETVHVTVADNGPGIAPEERPKVTERFYRSDASRGTPGVGLGLSLVAAVAALHRGRLELTDNHPGLRATLVLSRSVCEDTASSRSPAQPASSAVRVGDAHGGIVGQ